ncbi:serine/threonine-protein kinase LMTK2-like [Thalassophryne amazonica]|uniref:serine/threonine-protein kinase LMTK2-like n=1 Tax=Thalassophryne amazonica TaxID=390379 RepID=UPI0014719130|nr:serine/threonine-protein kinase LMTK2-like [Thalassophryne amazonica]
MTTNQEMITVDQNVFLIFHEDYIPKLFGNICYPHDDGMSREITDLHASTNNNVSSNFKNATAYWLSSSVKECEDVSCTERLRDSGQTCSGPTSGSDRNIKKRKSVLFDEAVTVYVFDQESPTLELHSEPHTSLSSNRSYNLPDVAFEDSGLEWEDDFSALEKSRHYQHVKQSVSQNCSRAPTRHSWTARSRPDRFVSSQTCLFLTHVAPSDLEP